MKTETRTHRMDGPVAEENRRAGTTEWQLRNCRFDDPVTLASYPLVRRLRSSAIEGYVSATSVYQGGSVDIKVSLDPPGGFRIEIYRMGFYGGAGGRHVATLGPFEGRTQPVPMMTVERLRECEWESCATLSIPEEWPSGVYLGKLVREEFYGSESYVVFVVKERRRSDILWQLSDLTWQAYNRWPGNDFPVQRRHPGGLVRRAEREGELRPALREVPHDHGQLTVHRVGGVPAMGAPDGLLAGAAGLRRDLLLQPRPGARPGCAGQVQGDAVGGPRRVLVEAHVRAGRRGQGRRDEHRLLLRQLGPSRDRDVRSRDGRSGARLRPEKTV